jgi:hypothetical protein
MRNANNRSDQASLSCTGSAVSPAFYKMTSARFIFSIGSGNAR